MKAAVGAKIDEYMAEKGSQNVAPAFPGDLLQSEVCRRVG
jgi:hypothetical protein